jgi:hypothetical protein
MPIYHPGHFVLRICTVPHGSIQKSKMVVCFLKHIQLYKRSSAGAVAENVFESYLTYITIPLWLFFLYRYKYYLQCSNFRLYHIFLSFVDKNKGRFQSASMDSLNVRTSLFQLCAGMIVPIFFELIF